MSNKYRELIERFQNLQPEFCDSLSSSLSEILDRECSLTFTSISTTNLENALKEFPGKVSVIGFAFEEIPSRQWMILPTDEFIHEETITNALARCFSLALSSVERIDSPPSDLRTELICSRYLIEMGDNPQTLLWLFDGSVLQKIIGESTSNVEEQDATPVSAKQSQKERDFEILMDIPLDINVELGRVKLTVQKIIELTPGNIIELEKTAGEPVDVYVNGRLVAKGEVVVVEENFGVRITEILSPHDRIGKLSEAA
ncbi:MAG TPA: flagellar motor switch protein FliN [Fimbriimonadales bacterium]|nr:flagellar motor switch protein FliN [Fimbriimonadales bacterium]